MLLLDLCLSPVFYLLLLSVSLVTARTLSATIVTYTPLNTPSSSHSPFCPTVLVLGLFPLFPPFSKPLGLLPSYPIILLSSLCLFPALTLLSPPLPVFRPQSLSVALISGSPRPLRDAAYRGPPSVLRCAPAPPWWGVLGVLFPVGITTGSLSMLPLSVLPLSAP